MTGSLVLENKNRRSVPYDNVCLVSNTEVHERNLCNFICNVKFLSSILLYIPVVFNINLKHKFASIFQQYSEHYGRYIVRVMWIKGRETWNRIPRWIRRDNRKKESLKWGPPVVLQ